ncbi:MAG: o-succinylbenzoate synthase, partial [Gammaproteobacteria bacterium]|nr:o-succinylbenzoate synthase [Gammaproteobacteria bacterium]
MSSEFIIRGQISPYRLCLRRPWMTARGGWWYRRGWLICLENGDGRCGYGDCAPWVDLGTETLDQAEKRLRQSIVDVIGVTPATALDTLDSWKGLPAARCGVETALLDLLAQQNGVSIAHWLNPETSPGVAVNSALGRLDDGISVRLHRAIAEGYRVCKIKVGTGTVDEELRRLEELCGSLPEGVGLRLDANRSWDHSTAERMVDALRGLPIESVEDPLAAWDPDALSALQNRAT